MKIFHSRIAYAITLASALALSSTLAPAAESMSVLLQKAIYAEETEGNLDSAIKIYEQISTEGVTNAALIAQARYRLAVCYQKQGNKEQAVAVLGDLLRQFPVDAPWAQKARAHLIALGQTSPESVTLRKVAIVNNTWFRAVSPSGRFIAYSGDNAELFMQEPAAGRTWQLLKSNWDNYPWGFVFSPDDRRVAYDLNGTTLYVSNADGSGLKEVYKAKDKDSLWPIRWVAASDQIVAELTDGNKKTKTVLSIDPNSGVVKQYDLAPIGGRGKNLSASGRYLGIQDNKKLSILDLETGKQQTLVEDYVKNILGWAPDDSELFFTSDRTGVNSLWVVLVNAGKAAGEPRLVKEGTADLDFVDVSPTGRVYYTESNLTASVCVAPVNLDTGDVTDEPRLITARFPGMHSLPVWSKDGGKLWIAIQGEQRRLLSVSLASGKQEEVPLAGHFKNWV